MAGAGGFTRRAEGAGTLAFAVAGDWVDSDFDTVGGGRVGIALVRNVEPRRDWTDFERRSEVDSTGRKAVREVVEGAGRD